MKRAILLSVLVAGIMLTGCKKPEQAPPTAAPQAVVPPGTDMAPAGGMMPANVPPPATYAPPAGPAASDLPGPGVYTPAPGPMGPVYEVKHGDTLWKIMTQYYGRPSQAMQAKIVAANPGMDPAKLKVGQKINMPAQ